MPALRIKNYIERVGTDEEQVELFIARSEPYSHTMSDKGYDILHKIIDR